MQKRSSFGANSGSWASTALSSACRWYVSGACSAAAAPPWWRSCRCASADGCWSCRSVGGAAVASPRAAGAPCWGESCVLCSLAGAQTGAPWLPPLLWRLRPLMQRSGTGTGAAASSIGRAGRPPRQAQHGVPVQACVQSYKPTGQPATLSTAICFVCKNAAVVVSDHLQAASRWPTLDLACRHQWAALEAVGGSARPPKSANRHFCLCVTLA